MRVAATQRNLSAEDTDLIEITLTTLFALDRLLHLLRDRSEHLDLLDLRLTWEDNRVGAYSCRTSVLANIQTFLQQKARWNAGVYTTRFVPEKHDEPSREISAEVFAQTARHALAEGISRESLMLSGSITTLRDGHVAPAGKVLDELIDVTRKPVPDAMLDEQDRLEELCDRSLVSLGRFLQAVVMQWKR